MEALDAGRGVLMAVLRIGLGRGFPRDGGGDGLGARDLRHLQPGAVTLIEETALGNDRSYAHAGIDGRAGRQLPTRPKHQARPVDCVWFFPDAEHRKRPTVGPVSDLSQKTTRFSERLSRFRQTVPGRILGRQDITRGESAVERPI